MLPGTTPRPSGRRAASTDSERQRIARYQAARELAAASPTVRGKKKPAILNLAVMAVVVPGLFCTVALPAYVATEVITRGLIALRDTRTPLMTNTGQLIGRVILITLFIQPLGVIAIPAAFAITSTLETLALGGVLWRKLSRRIAAAPMEGAAS